MNFHSPSGQLIFKIQYPLRQTTAGGLRGQEAPLAYMRILNQRVATLPPILCPKQTPVEKKEFKCSEGTGSSAHLWKGSNTHTSIVAPRRPCNHNLVVIDSTLDIYSFPVVLPQGQCYGSRWIISSPEKEMSRSIVMSTVTPTTPLILNSENPLLPCLKWMSHAISLQGPSAVYFCFCLMPSLGRRPQVIPTYTLVCVSNRKASVCFLPT